MSTVQVLIAGAGISGPVLAFWLARAGFDVTIIERSADLRATGQQLDFTGQAVVVMRMMGIEDDVRAALCPEPGMQFVDGQGKRVAYFPANKAGERSFSVTEEIEIMRGDLVRILYKATKNLPNVKYVFGTHIESFAQDSGLSGGKVHVTFADGSQNDYDVLVGAEGIGSATRRVLLDPKDSDPRHDMGFHLAYFTAPASSDDNYNWTIRHLPGRKIFMTRKDRDDCIRVYLAMFGKHCQALDRAETFEEQTAAILDIFGDSKDEQLQKYLSHLGRSPMSKDLYSQHMTRIRLPQGGWSRQRVVLLGDGAYSTSAGGVGTTAAVVGGYVLAGELLRQWEESKQSLEAFNAEKASKEYERVMRPLVDVASTVSPWMLSIFAPDSRLGIRLLHLILSFVATLRIDKLLMRFSTPEESEKLLYDDYFGIFRDTK